MSSLGAPARTDPSYTGDETTMLRAYLDHHRDTFRWKTRGLDQGQLTTVLPPSTLTLAGLVKHLALVEVWWSMTDDDRPAVPEAFGSRSRPTGPIWPT